jgi:hypothetical protein
VLPIRSTWTEWFRPGVSARLVGFFEIKLLHWSKGVERRDVRVWPIATFRGDAAIQSLSELSGHSASHAWIAAAIHDAWSFWV